MAVSWADLKIPESDFEVSMLHSALDSRRVGRSMTWAAVARAIKRADERNFVPPIRASTIRG